MPTLGPPYRIETPRLVLRCWEPADAPALSALIERNLDFLRGRQRWAAAEPKPAEQRVAELRRWRAEFDLDHWWRYAVVDAGEGTLAGAAVLFPAPARFAVQTAGWTGREHAERGHAAEAAAALARVAFELLGAPRLLRICSDGDEASEAVCRELGFTNDGAERHLHEGARIADTLWSLLPNEWPDSRAAALSADDRAFDVLGNRLF